MQKKDQDSFLVISISRYDLVFFMVVCYSVLIRKAVVFQFLRHSPNNSNLNYYIRQI